jgi:uncharacterized protein
MTEEVTQFPLEVVEKLKTYVYRLVDPRNGETFYVGKGKGNRVFAHIHAEVAEADEDNRTNKLQQIREIRLADFEVAHVIHRHGMDDATAFQVEAALMDAYPGLTNIAGGVGSGIFGAAHAREIVQRYAAEEAVFDHRTLLINVNRTATDAPLIEATRYAWKVNLAKAKQAEVILATVHGIIRGAFVASEWHEATAEHFPDREPVPGRYGFIGTDAPEAMRKLYVGKRVPDDYRKPGSANPVRYTGPDALFGQHPEAARLRVVGDGDGLARILAHVVDAEDEPLAVRTTAGEADVRAHELLVRPVAIEHVDREVAEALTD